MAGLEFLGQIDWLSLWVPTPVALALVALIGYLIGRRAHAGQEPSMVQARLELRRARAVAKELEQIAEAIRGSLGDHSTSLARFKERVRDLSATENAPTWKELCKEAEEILGPTLRLATQIANAYDEIRQQSSYLMSFTEVRTDPLTGVSNRRALDEMLEMMFAMRNRCGQEFSLAIFDIDNFKRINDEHGHLVGDHILQQVAKIISDTARETDFVARYGGEEFVVVMPHTDLEGAMTYAERIRREIARHELHSLKATISGGVAAAEDGDDITTLLGRADAALYHAKAEGRNRIFYQSGDQAGPVDAAPAANSWQEAPH